MADSVTTLAQQMRPFWLRDLGASAAAQSGGGSGMIAHSLNGGYHTGTLDEAQAPWAVTDTEFGVHAGNPDAHHARSHNITSASDHTITATSYQLVGATAINTLGLLTPLNDVSAGDTAILRSASGTLTVATLTAGTKLRTPLIDTVSGDLSIAPTGGHVTIGGITLATSNNVGTEPDILLNLSGLIAAENSLYLNIDSTNTTTASAVIFSKDAGTSAGTEIARLSENGTLRLGGGSPIISTPTGQSLTLQTADDVILDPGSNLVKTASGVTLQADNYASQTTGWGISYAGSADFRYLFTDELHAKSFIADLEQALAGGQIISKSVAILAVAFTAPAASGTATLRVRDLPSAANMAVFQANDIVRLRTFSRAAGSLSITDCWGVVTAYADQSDGTQTWTFTRSAAPNAGAMTAGTVVNADSLVLDYGTTGNGFYEVNAIDGVYASNSPYSQIVSWTTHPATGQTVRARLGNLAGIFSVANEYGLFAGAGTANTDAYMRISNNVVRINNVNLQMYNSGTKTFELASDGTSMWIGPSSSNKQFNYDSGSLTITGTITALAGYIGTAANGWTINSASVTADTIRLYAGAETPATARVEVGDYASAATGAAGVVGLTGNDGDPARVSLWAGRTYTYRANAPFRVTLGGDLYASSATITGAITATSGYIGSTTSGWTINSASITADTIRLYAGAETAATARIEVGDYAATGSGALGVIGLTGNDGATTRIALWAGRNFANRASAPFRVTLGGAITATDATVTGAITASSGSITGNFYTGTNNNRFSTDGIRLKMPATSELNINTSPAAFRWFEDLDVSPTAATNYVGMLGYRNTAGGNNVVDALTTAYVGTSNYTTYSARVGLQAGNSDGSNYRSSYLLVIKDPGANDSGSIQCTASQTIIDGMLGLVPKAATTFTQDRATIYFSAGGNLVIAFYNGTTTKYRYMTLTGTNATWNYSTSAPS